MNRQPFAQDRHAKPLGDEPLRYDLDLIVQRLRETAETWVPRLFPNGRRSGDEWRLANIRGDAPRKMGSCVIALRGAHAGDWIDFDGNQGGGPISAIEEATGLRGRALIVQAAEMAGALRATGAMPVVIPMIELAPLDSAATIRHEDEATVRKIHGMAVVARTVREHAQPVGRF